MSRTRVLRTVLLAAVGLGSAQVAAAFCGCIKKEPPMVEAEPALVMGWADPEVLAKHHPLWAEYEQMYAAVEGVAFPAPPPDLASPDLPSEHTLEQEPIGRADMEQWRDMARSALRGPEATPEPPEEMVSAQAVLEAEATLSSRREGVGQEAGAEALEAESRIARERFDHSLTTRNARVMADLGPANDSRTTSDQIMGDLDRWTTRKAREEEARIRADAAKALKAADLERDAELLDVAIRMRQRRDESSFDLERERDDVSAFMRPVDRGQDTAITLDTSRMARRERELADATAKARTRLDSTVAAERQTARETLDSLRTRLLSDARRMAYSLARAEGIELTFEPSPGREDLTQEVADLLDHAYTTPDIEIEDLSPPGETEDDD